MNRLFLKFGITLFIAVAWVAVNVPSAQAYTNSRLMDDQVFDDVNSMTEQQIRDFINARPNTCLTRVGAGFGGGAIYPEPITYWEYGGNVDAARVIYNSARYSDINPQVVLATLQKEQSLFTDTDCLDQDGIARLPKAMGQGCLEGGACPTEAYAGFHKQVMKGAWQLKFNKERAIGNVEWGDNGSISYGMPYTEGYRKACSTCANIYRDGFWTIDGQTVKMETGATASLYRYTPHLGQAFPSIFESWFGSTYYGGNDPAGSFDLVQQAPSAIRLAGWGLDRSMEGPAGVHVYVDGAFRGVITANVMRGDVGPHGFDGTVSWTTAGSHQVCAWVIGDSLGKPNAGLGCKTVFINNDTAGSLDLALQAPSAIRLAGWGLDRSLAGPAGIHVYVDGTFKGSITANMVRGDVGPHGFDGVIPWTEAGSHQVCAWVVGDSLGIPNTGLGCRSISINNDATGSLDLTQVVSGGVRLAGWGLDRSLDGPASIHVYIDGTWKGAITASNMRGDVGPHGFDGIVSWSVAGNHQVCAWVVGDNVGAPNAGLGCRQFTF
jgi:hypothetical protein